MTLCVTLSKRIWRQFWFFVAKTNAAVRHLSSITTGFSRQAMSSCSPYMLTTTFGGNFREFSGILKVSLIQVTVLRLIQYDSLLERTDFQTNPTPWRRNNILHPQTTGTWTLGRQTVVSGCRAMSGSSLSLLSVTNVASVTSLQQQSWKAGQFPMQQHSHAKGFCSFPGSTFLLPLKKKAMLYP